MSVLNNCGVYQIERESDGLKPNLLDTDGIAFELAVNVALNSLPQVLIEKKAHENDDRKDQDA
ncbi:MAG: hypothetical protein ACREQP_06325 [Candidatus Binatia bacterium]